MRIKVLAVEVKEVKEGKKDYKLLDVSYKNLEFNKVEGKKIVSFASPDVFNALKDAQPGDEFDVTKGEKSSAGFVPWTRCTTATGASEADQPRNVPSQSAGGSAQRSTSSPRSTYETPEERAKKQVYIVRQSSISNAIEYFSAFGVTSESTVEDVLKIAKIFENYVMDNDPVKALIDMEDDVPL